jgi:FtsZ-interacting cell division protein ZipA
MSIEGLIVGAVAIVAILIVASWLYAGRQRNNGQRRSEQLRERFGSEYDRTLAEKGDARSTEQDLAARQKRVSQMTIRPIAADEGARFSDEWRVAQGTFVDDPAAAVRDADALVGRVMDARGYPEGDFEQRFADVSVDHPATLPQYRTAHEIGLRHAQGQASTEDLRQVMVNDHALFNELLVDQAPVETLPVAETPAETLPAAEIPEPVAV